MLHDLIGVERFRDHPLTQGEHGRDMALPTPTPTQLQQYTVRDPLKSRVAILRNVQQFNLSLHWWGFQHKYPCFSPPFAKREHSLKRVSMDLARCLFDHATVLPYSHGHREQKHVHLSSKRHNHARLVFIKMKVIHWLKNTCIFLARSSCCQMLFLIFK